MEKLGALDWLCNEHHLEAQKRRLTLILRKRGTLSISRVTETAKQTY